MKRKKPSKPLVHKFRLLKGPWADVDMKMLHACFDFLRDFVEKEKGLEMLKQQYDYWNKLPKNEREVMRMSEKDVDCKTTEALKIYNKIEKLYNWWRNEYTPLWKSTRCQTIKEEKDEQDYLLELIKIRRYLWT
jgi:hypothetical protein